MFKWECTYVHTHVRTYVAIENSHDGDVAKAHATVLNLIEKLLSNHVARGEIAVRRFDLKGLC